MHLTGNSKGAFRGFGRRSLLAIAAAVTILFVGLGIFVISLVMGHNFHEVSAGQVYRSAQMDALVLSNAIQSHGIKSVMNLRGANADLWYNAETNMSRQLGVEHYDFKLSAGQELTDGEMEQILKTITAAPKPLLIHCKSGADRTGLIGALYLYSVEGKSAETADRELTVLCGHFPYLFWRDTVAMDRSYWRYVGKHAPAPVGAVKLASPLAKQD